jgi:catechol 2,3-dioxygenase-like lactoylglutathione lyase family enzyme
VDVRVLHHVSLPVGDLERSRRFYREVLGLEEIARPPFPFPGAWFRLGDRELHLIAGEGAVPRGAEDADADPRRLHFAVRVASFWKALEHLRDRGYREDAREGDPTRVLALPRSVVGYPQLYVLDPDRHLVELNAERLDG